MRMIYCCVLMFAIMMVQEALHPFLRYVLDCGICLLGNYMPEQIETMLAVCRRPPNDAKTLRPAIACTYFEIV